MTPLNLPADHTGLTTRPCKKCGEVKGPDSFSVYKHKACHGGYQALSICKECDRERKLRSHLTLKYGITLEEFEAMSKKQGNKCHLCDEEPTDIYGKLVVDHCHETGKVRALLCRMCNIHLSKVEKCPDYLKKVIAYLS